MIASSWDRDLQRSENARIEDFEDMSSCQVRISMGLGLVEFFVEARREAFATLAFSRERHARMRRETELWARSCSAAE